MYDERVLIKGLAFLVLKGPLLMNYIMRAKTITKKTLRYDFRGHSL